MKQKNLILVAVAVGCGLVAAFLTSQMNAKPAVEQVAVPVAAKDIDIGTKLTKDDLKTYVVMKKVSKEALPQVFVANEAELTDKWLKRPIHAGETFNPADLSGSASISPPKGKSMMTIAADATQAVAGFAGPGAHVDIIASVQLKTKRGETVVFPLLTNMLVLAIDGHVGMPEKNASFQNLSKVSFAVDNKQAMLLHAAVARGANLRLVLLNRDEPAVWEKVPTEAEIWAILSEVPQPAAGGSSETGDAPAATTVKLPVPAEDLPAGTELTAEVIEKKFKLMEMAGPAPANVALTLKDHTGKFLTDRLAANQFVPLSFLGAKPKEVAPPPVAAAPKATTPPADPPVFFDSTVQTSSGFKKYRYQVLKSGQYEFLGEVRLDGTLKPVEDTTTAPPTAGTDPKPGADDKPADRVF